MVAEPRTDFRLGDWLVEPALGRVSRDGQTATLRPREMDLLVYLARHQGGIVTADDIIANVWAGVAVTNDSLYFSISQLRKALDANEAEQSLIETIPKRGYRLTVAVESIDDPGDRLVHASADDSADSWRRALPIAAAFAVIAFAIVWFGEDDPPTQSLLPVDEQNSIAVMPFVDLSPDADYTYFSDGITEEILSQLTRVPGLQVAARTSSFSFKGSDADVVEIGESLGVGTLLEGSVRKEGDRVRIAVQLIDATSGFHIWSDSWDRELSSVLAVQNEISRQITDALQLTLADGGGGKSDRRTDPVVIDEYLLGIEALRVSSFDSLARAIDHFETVLELDTDFYKARIQLAAAKLQLLNSGASYDMELVAEADALVSDVLTEHPNDATAHRVMGLTRKWQRRREEAIYEFNRALELAPSDSESMVQLSMIEGFSGDVDRARQLLERAARIDPFGPMVLSHYGYAQRQLGAIDRAYAALLRAVEVEPGNPNPPWMLGKLQANDLGNVSGGLQSFLQSARNDDEDYEIPAYIALTYLTLEMPDAAEPWVKRALEDGPDTVTTQATEAVRLTLLGNENAGAAIAIRALEEKSYRFTAHALATAPLIMIATSDLLGSGRAEDAVRLFEASIPEAKGVLLTDEASVQHYDALAYSDLPRRWLLSLAYAYKAAGRDEDLQRILDHIAPVRIDAIDRYRDQPRYDDYLFEAEVRAMLGDEDGAFEMLEAAVDTHLLFNWQIQLLHNAPLADLHADPRFAALVDRVRANIASEREQVIARSRLLSGSPGDPSADINVAIHP